jgi:hypothetical protein
MHVQRSASEMTLDETENRPTVASVGSADGHRYALAIALLNDARFRELHREATQAPTNHERQPMLDNDPKEYQKRKWDKLLAWVEERREDGEFEENVLDDEMFAPFVPKDASLKDGATLKKYIHQAMSFYNTISSNYSRSGKGISGEASYRETLSELEAGDIEGAEEAEVTHTSSSSSSAQSPLPIASSDGITQYTPEMIG